MMILLLLLLLPGDLLVLKNGKKMNCDRYEIKGSRVELVSKGNTYLLPESLIDWAKTKALAEARDRQRAEAATEKAELKLKAKAKKRTMEITNDTVNSAELSDSWASDHISGSDFNFDPSRVKVNVGMAYYEIKGVTAKDLRQQMRVHGLRGDDGVIYSGHINWSLGWQYEFEMIEGQCKPVSVTVMLDAVIRMPKWINEPQAAHPLRKEWFRFYHALEDHEKGHLKIAKKGAAEMYRTLSALAYENCNALSVKVDPIARAILERYKRNQEEYDRSTDHGSTQGANLRNP